MPIDAEGDIDKSTNSIHEWRRGLIIAIIDEHFKSDSRLFGNRPQHISPYDP